MNQEKSRNIRISNDVYLELKKNSVLFNTSLSNSIKILLHGFREELKQIENAKKLLDDLEKIHS